MEDINLKKNKTEPKHSNNIFGEKNKNASDKREGYENIFRELV